MNGPARARNRCGIILAAGDGERVGPLIRRLRGHNLPKQYVNFIGRRSMLEHTLCRAEMLIPRDRLFTVVSKDHLRYPQVWRQLASRAARTVVFQPENKETGPGVLLPLMYIRKRDPDSTVAMFPSDHFIVEEGLFMTYVDLAFRVVERDRSCLVLLGMEPSEAEPEYGYITPGNKVGRLAPLPVHEVLRFVEKPAPHAARKLIQEGGLWNTLVMVFSVDRLLHLVRMVAPALYRRFENIYKAIGRSAESDVIDETYRDIDTVNFSRGLLEPISTFHGTSLLVMPVKGVLWSDWGSEQRILSVLRRDSSLARSDAPPDNQSQPTKKIAATQ